MAVIKTMVMFTGEFDASSLELEDGNPVIPVVFIFFVFLMTIVLFNLLNALAIDDTQRIRQEGELIDLCERVEVVNTYERIFLGQYGSKDIKKTICIFPHTVPQGKIVIHPDNRNEVMIFKALPTKKEVTIPIDAECFELEEFVNSVKCKNRLEASSLKLDENVMMAIRKILQKRKLKQDHKEEESSNGKLESEVQTLKQSIQELTAKFNLKYHLDD